MTMKLSMKKIKKNRNRIRMQNKALIRKIYPVCMIKRCMRMRHRGILSRGAKNIPIISNNIEFNFILLLYYIN